MERYEFWIERAKSSFEISKLAVNIHADVYYEDLCYQSQQAVEKVLKGLLIYYGVEPEFTHNIEILLKELKNFTEIPDHIKEAVQLTNYAVQTRYPGEYDEVTKEEYENSIKIAKDCLDWVKIKIKERKENKKS
ncbi:MAG: HEPN domain-containing protein [Planctomycetaceae bacterium]|jgi:HEPN domain-containing protein|nr:HEPN domain-containing protein [Planctomycetaceae bacterium]